MILQDLHSHSNWSDGENSVEEMVKAAVDIGLKRFAITDHVWKSSAWVWDYLDECSGIKEKYKNTIDVLCGFEAKCIDRNGSVDILDEVANKADIVLGAIHRIPKGEGTFFTRREIQEEPIKAFNLWFEATLNMLSNPNITTVAHVTAALSKYNLVDFLTEEHIGELLKAFRRNGKEIEINLRYNDPVPIMVKHMDKNLKSHIGSDAHSKKNLIALWGEIMETIN